MENLVENTNLIIIYLYYNQYALTKNSNIIYNNCKTNKCKYAKIK